MDIIASSMLQGLKSGGELLKLGIADNDPKAIQSGWRLFDKNQAKIYDLVLDMRSPRPAGALARTGSLSLPNSSSLKS